jgi:excisionase family DNA binding protein
MDKLLVDIPEAAKMLSISRSALYLLLSEQAIKSVKCGKSRRVIVSSLTAWIESLPTGTLNRKDVVS